MKRILLAAPLAAFLLAAHPAQAESLQGPIGDASGPNWQASWMNLAPSRDFKRGDRLRLKLHGSAEWVLVRLLPDDASPASSKGIVGGKIRVPAGGLVEVGLPEDRPRVKQVSVHAGDEAWGMPIARANGRASIVAVELAK